MNKLVFLFVLGLSLSAQAQVPFSDGFESGNAPWDYVDGDVRYPTTGCRSGACGEMRMVGGRDQQSVYWAKNTSHAGESFYVGAWWRFPVGFSWDPGGQPWGLEHKMMIINTGNDVGRVLLNLRGDGLSPEIAVHLERLDSLGGGISKRSGVRWPADGAWHHFEIELTRRAGTAGRVQVWLDGARVIDETGRVCGTPCSPIRDVQLGAFSNQGAPRAQSFFLDDARITGAPRTSTPLPPSPAPPTQPVVDRVKALEAISRALDELDLALKALGQ